MCLIDLFACAVGSVSNALYTGPRSRWVGVFFYELLPHVCYTVSTYVLEREVETSRRDKVTGDLGVRSVLCILLLFFDDFQTTIMTRRGVINKKKRKCLSSVAVKLLRS